MNRTIQYTSFDAGVKDDDDDDGDGGGGDNDDEAVR